MKYYRYLNQDNQVEIGYARKDGSIYVLERDTYGDVELTEDKADVRQILAPLEPTNILCLGLNYRAHANESGMSIPDFPILFMKSTNTVQHPNLPIVLPRKLASEQVDYEGELAVVIGKTAKNVSRDDAMDYVLGYTCANDVSARDWQLSKGGGQWCRGKVFDTFCPLGPAIVTRDEIDDPARLTITTRLSGEIVQQGRVDDLIFDIPAIIEFLSGSTTLLPGTVILTGTPSGVGMAARPPRFLAEGDIVEIEIDEIGTLSNPVVCER